MDVLECKIEYLEAAMMSIVIKFDGQEELLNKIKHKFEQFKKGYDGKRVGYCLEKYINAELDFVTAGNRGIGRLTELIPRFGAYFRKALRNMSEVDLSKLYDIIQDLILRGYLVHVLFVEESVRGSVISSGEDLYEKWIPGIYAEDPSVMGEALRNVLAISTESGYKTLKKFMNSHKMIGGSFFSIDKTDQIVFYYPLAGFGLGVVETKGY